MPAEVRRANSTMRRMYRHLLQRSEDEFLSRLSDNILQGSTRQVDVLEQLDLLKAHDKTPLLNKCPPDCDENLLQQAAIFHGDITVMRKLATLCPGLLLQHRQGDYEGQNVLHTLVSKQNVEGVRALLGDLAPDRCDLLLHGKAVGPCFAATVMMGELPLSVAALTFNVDMLDVLLVRGARLHWRNTQGDTLLHSLIRFAEHHPDQEVQVTHMMRKVHERLQDPRFAPYPQVEPRCVWLVENEEGLTALRLAAALALPSLFQFILHLEGVYNQLDRHDGLFDSLLYDVTEIDPVARQQWRVEKTRRARQRTTHHAGCCPGLDSPKRYSSTTNGKKREEQGRGFVSVLEIICETNMVDKAFGILSTPVVRSIVKAKWHHYLWWFVLWGVFHVLFMALLTGHAICKARLVQQAAADTMLTSVTSVTSATGANATRTQTTSLAEEKAFVAVAAIMTVPVSVVVVVMEVVRWWRKLPFHLWLIHHNGLYRLQLLVFAVSLLADSVWYWASGPVNNFFLTLALLVGWWFCTFFLRPWRKFSFFTVMLQKVLLGDMLRFSTIIVLELVAFCAAMYITFLSTPGPMPEEFEHFGMTVLTMFKLMLGLGEVEVLGRASHPWLSITLFVLFVVLTYLLMLNALIAMMSNTCSLVSENKVSQWELQRLSVVLLMESMLPWRRLLYNSGWPMHVATFDLSRKEMLQEIRYFTKVTSAQTTYTERERGAAILKRKHFMQTQRFDDLHAMMIPEDNVVTSARNVGHLDLLSSFTYQQVFLGSSRKFTGVYHHHHHPEGRPESPDPTPNMLKASSSAPDNPYSHLVRQHQPHAWDPERKEPQPLPWDHGRNEPQPLPWNHGRNEPQPREESEVQQEARTNGSSGGNDSDTGMRAPAAAVISPPRVSRKPSARRSKSVRLTANELEHTSLKPSSSPSSPPSRPKRKRHNRYRYKCRVFDTVTGYCVQRT
ncbi:transient receptor potential cation channel subfamily V member 6-like [Babylonia areolata]|uniref:transient receptor potential cation channel subfamily V member 6-like n=1 Tax=Babylonia areolata TaxID=304850 RepID=UPI003FD14317